MQSSLSYAKDSLGQASTILADGERLFRLANEAESENPALAEKMREISLSMLRNGQAMLDNARKVEKSFSKRF